MLLFKVTVEHLSYYRQKGINLFIKHPVRPILKPDASFEQHQVLLGHCSQVAMLLSVMTVTCQRASKESSTEAIELADEFCTNAREKISIHCIKIKNYHGEREKTVNRRGTKIMNGNYASIVEQNIVPQELPNIRN